VIHRDSSRRIADAFARGLELHAGPRASILVRDPVDLPVLGSVLSRVVPWVNEFARSDHLPFWEAGIPAVQVTDTANYRNPHYHKPTDTPETLDYDRLAAIVGALAVAVDELGRTDRPTGPKPPT
jgi:hypothetical protein